MHARIKLFLENRSLMFFLIFVAVSLVTVIAGNMTINQGSLSVSDNLSIDSNTLFVDSSNNYVGVGTTSPLSMLHVNLGSILGSDVNAITLESTGQYTGDEIRILFTNTGSTYNLGYIGSSFQTSTSDSYLSFATRNADSVNERMRITAQGNIGINTSNPTTILSVGGLVNLSQGNLTQNTQVLGIPVFIRVGAGKTCAAHCNNFSNVDVLGNRNFTCVFALDQGQNASVSCTTTSNVRDCACIIT